MHFEGILPKEPYLPCVSMAGKALLAGYRRFKQHLLHTLELSDGVAFTDYACRYKQIDKV